MDDDALRFDSDKLEAEAILTHRELERRDVSEVVGFDDRKSRRVTAMLHSRASSRHRLTGPHSESRFRLPSRRD